METDQLAWYIQLLADSWEAINTPQATLPNDDLILKSMSRYDKTVQRERDKNLSIRRHLIAVITAIGKELTAEKAIDAINSVMGLLLEEEERSLQARWDAVRRQFKTGGPSLELIYSPRLISELGRWRDAYRQRSRGGQAAAVARWGPGANQTSKELADPDMVVPHPILDAQNGTAIADPLDLNRAPVLSNESKGDLRIDQPSQNGSQVAVPNASIADPSFSMVIDHNSTIKTTLSVDQNVSTSSKDKEGVKRLVKKRKKPETLFEEDKFTITEQMFANLRPKYPEFVLGDWEYLVEKFKNVYHGKTYISWARTFYNFVGNQVTLYGYKPGQYDWRRAEAQRSTEAPIKKTMTAAERNAEAERIADEYTNRLLQGNRVDANQEDSEVLPLTSDDVRDA